MSTPQAASAPTFSVRDGALADLQFALMAQDMQWARPTTATGHERLGRTVVAVNFGESWTGRRDAALYSLCLTHHHFGEDMVGLRVKQRASALPLAPVMIVASLLHRRG